MCGRVTGDCRKRRTGAIIEIELASRKRCPCKRRGQYVRAAVWASVPPKILKAIGGKFAVSDRMLDILVPEVVL